METDKLAHTYNKIAGDYSKDHENDSWDNDFLDFFSEALFQGARVLDLGCGPGVETKKLSMKGFDVQGFDLSEGLLQIAREKLPFATFLQGDMLKRFPYADNFFDGVFAKASLLHVPKEKMDGVFDEIYRILKPNGILHIAVKQGSDEKEVVENDYGYEYERFFSYWQPDELNNLFLEHNLKLLKEDSWTNPGKKTLWLKYLLKK